jgi:hypothetical protein
MNAKVSSLKIIYFENNNFFVKFLAPYCTKKFFSKNNFRDHLIQESNKPSSSQYISEITNQIISLDHKRPPVAGRKETKEGQYQCLYCLYGTDVKGKI